MRPETHSCLPGSEAILKRKWRPIARSLSNTLSGSEKQESG